MKFARITAVFGGILLAAALAGPAAAAETGVKGTSQILTGEAGAVGSNAALVDLDKLRARGPGKEGEASTRTREAVGPILLIFLLQQNRFSDGLDVLQPVTAR
jgi:hypothetical protein